MRLRHLGLVLVVAVVIASFAGWLFLSADPETNGEAQTVEGQTG